MTPDDIQFLPPGVSEAFADASGLGFGYVTDDYLRTLILPRREDAHKGTYGHALLVCGSEGMVGAAVLATGAALRSGCGLVTVHLPATERVPVQTNFPSALFSLDPAPCFSQLPADMSRYTAVGAGCGLGRDPRTGAALDALIDHCREASVPLVLDADALNWLAAHPDRLDRLPAGTILTPHAGELRRLVGEWSDEEEKFRRIAALAARIGGIVVSKGPNTAICDAGRSIVCNSTGNDGMAKGGSGDILTGLLTGLLARGYTPRNAAVVGVFLHGAAGDKAAEYFGREAMNSSDLIDFLAEAWKDAE